MQHAGNHRNLLIGTIIIAVVACLSIGLVFTLLSTLAGGEVIQKEAKLGIVPYIASTSTQTIAPTPILPTPENIDGIQLGSVVQIFGTDGVGLKIRTQAGVQSAQLFIALDSEIFEVTDGPIRLDDYVWWQLTSPYDTQRSGWAVSKYLTTIN